MEEPLATALDVDGDGELARSRLLGKEKPELQGVVVREAGEDEIPLLCLHPLLLLIEIRCHAPRMPPLDRRPQARRRLRSTSRARPGALRREHSPTPRQITRDAAAFRAALLPFVSPCGSVLR